MKKILKNTVKFTLGVCAALSVVTVGAVIASGATVKIMAEGFKAGAEAMKSTMDELKAETKQSSAAEPADEDLADVETAE